MNSETSSPIVLSAGVKTAGILLPCLGLVLYVTAQIGSDEYKLPILLVLGIFAALVGALLIQQARFEAVVIGFLMIGYFVGSRGFADLAVFKPLYVGELSLVAIGLAILGRRILGRETIETAGVLPKLILLYLAYAVIRFFFDVKTYQLDSVRDLAVVYYCAFFFFAIQISRHAAERVFIDKCLCVALLGQALVAIVISIRPEWFDSTEVSLSPLAQKGDLLATFSAVGVYFFYTRKAIFGFKWLRSVIICLLLATIFGSIARSGMLALCISGVLLWVAGRPRFFIYPILVLAAGLSIVLIATIFVKDHDQNARIVDFKETLLSAVDFSGQVAYHSDLGEMKSSNNEFRRMFWKSMIEETTADHPIVGKGFGYDFRPRFEQIYNAGTWEGLRSPHNYFVTVYGRMGIIGLLIFGAIAGFVVQQGIASALRVRRGELPLEVLGYWCGTWVVLISAMVGVVLEGPMGGIIFWTFLGLGYSRSRLPVEKTVPVKLAPGVRRLRPALACSFLRENLLHMPVRVLQQDSAPGPMPWTRR